MKNETLPIVGISCGDPNGIGIEVILKSLNDKRILKNGTAYQTDAGMCGDYDSVIGMNKSNSLNRFLKKQLFSQIYQAMKSRLFSLLLFSFLAPNLYKDHS